MQRTEILEYLQISPTTLYTLVSDGYIEVDKSNKAKHQYFIKDEEFFKTFDEEKYISFKKERGRQRRSKSMKAYISEHPKHKELISKRTSEELRKISKSLSERTKEMWKNEDIRKRILESRGQAYATHEYRTHRSELTKKQWEENRDSMYNGVVKRQYDINYRAKISKILKEVYKNQDVRDKISKAIKKSYEENGADIMEKRIETKRKNNTLVSSKPQMIYTDWLNSTGLTIETEKQYPIETMCHCDWYIKELDLWVEGHFGWRHCGKPFENTKEDIKYLEKMKEKASNCPEYNNAIYTWTDLDVRKLNAAKTANLNFKALYSCEDFEELFSEYHIKDVILRPWDNWKKVYDSISDVKKENVFARKCEILEIDRQTAKKFLNEHHFQGATHSSQIHIGLYYSNNLIELMTFGEPRYNKSYQYELLRLCTHKNYNVVGGASKILNHFENTYKPKSLLSYCDLDKFSGKVYETLGFTHKSTAKSRHWYNFELRQHFTDNLVRKLGVDKLLGTDFGKGTDNDYLLRKLGFKEIYDSGQATFTKIYYNKGA